MNTLTVNTVKPYTIKIGSRLLHTIGTEISLLGKAATVCIVSDSNVYPLYGKAVTESLEKAGFVVTDFVFPAGEQMKKLLL